MREKNGVTWILNLGVDYRMASPSGLPWLWTFKSSSIQSIDERIEGFQVYAHSVNSYYE